MPRQAGSARSRRDGGTVERVEPRDRRAPWSAARCRRSTRAIAEPDAARGRLREDGGLRHREARAGSDRGASPGGLRVGDRFERPDRGPPPEPPTGGRRADGATHAHLTAGSPLRALGCDVAQRCAASMARTAGWAGESGGRVRPLSGDVRAAGRPAASGATTIRSTCRDAAGSRCSTITHESCIVRGERVGGLVGELGARHVGRTRTARSSMRPAQPDRPKQVDVEQWAATSPVEARRVEVPVSVPSRLDTRRRARGAPRP